MSARAALVLALLTAIGCHKAGAPVAASTAPTPLEPAPFVPANAVCVAVFDGPSDWLGQLAAVSGMAAPAALALHDDLATYFKKSTGLDLSAVHRGTVFVTPDAFAVIVRDVKGDWKAAPLKGDFVLARHEDYLVFGSPAAVEAALAVADGKQPGLAKDSVIAKLFAQESAGAGLAAAADLAAVKIPEWGDKIAQVGATHALVSLGKHGVHLVAYGDGKKLGDFVSMVETQLAAAAKAGEQQKQRVLAEASTEKGPAFEDVAMVLGAHSMAHLAAIFHPKVVGNQLRFDLPVDSPNITVVVGIVGVLAAVAIPAFMKYMRKSKSMEAVSGVKRIYDGARSYYLAHKKLPASIAVTPAPGACCGQPNDTCAPDAKQWAAWKPIGFSMSELYRYSYQLDSDGTTFTARAIGDLDCNGVFSTFEMVGMVMPDGSFKAGPGIYKNHELE